MGFSPRAVLINALPWPESGLGQFAHIRLYQQRDVAPFHKASIHKLKTPFTVYIGIPASNCQILEQMFHYCKAASISRVNFSGFVKGA